MCNLLSYISNDYSVPRASALHFSQSNGMLPFLGCLVACIVAITAPKTTWAGEPEKEAPSGIINIKATPWAKVVINGKEYGLTPQQVLVAPGRYRVVLVKGQVTKEIEVTVRAAEVVEIAESMAAGKPAQPATARNADGVPSAVGQCVSTAIKEIGYRLEGTPDSGDLIVYTNGETQVSYDPIPGAKGSRPGDRVELCLVSIPKKCPKGDTRGRVYKATNMRTGKTWSASNSSHYCGGA